MLNPKPILLCIFGYSNQLQSEFMVPESRGISTTSIVSKKLTMGGTTTYNYVTGDKGRLKMEDMIVDLLTKDAKEIEDSITHYMQKARFFCSLEIDFHDICMINICINIYM